MKLVLADGSVFTGESFGSECSASGECVFQTGMTSYVESLTDPSYRGQILVLSYPLIGNYGVPPTTEDENHLPKFFESGQIQVAGLVVADYSEHYSHWNSTKSLSSWLKENKIPAITGVDTRELIKKIRNEGSVLAKLVQSDQEVDKIKYDDPNSRNLVAEVSSKKVIVYGNGDLQVTLVDCGMKVNQLRCLLKRGVKVKVVPWDYDFVKDQDTDALFLSNGPGDPTKCDVTIQNIKKFMDRESKSEKPIPLFGICLGNQLLGLAAGAKTYKLKFGNRGQNQPCVDVKSGRCHLTMQNHGYAIDSQTLPPMWEEFFYNANDKTNEGIHHAQLPFFSVQFHPEAKGGPKETEYLFDYFIHLARNRKEGKISPFNHPFHSSYEVTPNPKIHKVLILGSGGLSIGQAGEFDYSGSQAIKALKEENIRTILINPNIATVQTTKGLADQVYFLPVTPEYVKKVIEIERPDGLFLQFGGQTALNCGVELYRQGYFEKMGVRVLGTPVESIIATEDREIFADKLKEIDEKIAPSLPARNVQEAIAAAESIGYPVIVRAGFALGGLGSGFAHNQKDLVELLSVSFSYSEMVLVEKSLKGWKEIEYEVVRDKFDNCLTVCNMENFDPLGIHTGESIVVAPSQTLSDRNYHMLRRVALKVIRHLKIVGECNIQYALDPNSDEYYIIEVNARLSRSSALASKATGYPLAFIAAKLSLGKSLVELRNSVTKSTTACFEPSLDYVVVKMPRWDLKKFVHVSTEIGTSMKSVGEVMAIGRSFEETISKAIRMVSGSSSGFGFESGLVPASDEGLSKASNLRIFVIADALAKGYSIDRIWELTRIDRWFLNKLKNISEMEKYLKSLSGQSALTPQNLLKAKKLGFSDNTIARCLNSTEFVIRQQRKKHDIYPFTKRIDTVSAEFPATNNYLYTTYHASADDVSRQSKPSGSIMVLGSGAYCIGSSVEFDWCAVTCARTLSKLGYNTIMVNYNPETVSTDYDECHKLYFEEISFERVTDIYERELPAGVVVSMGGQIPNNISMALSRQGINILGTSAESIDNAENRYKFSRLLDKIKVDQPEWRECKGIEDIKQFCQKVSYPCLVRPSFVLSGAGMNVVNTDGELENYLKIALAESKEYSVVISKFISNAKEIDVDAVAQNGEVVIYAISEHVENAGVHSGDATLVLPAQDIDEITTKKIVEATKLIAKHLDVSGPFNIQYIAKDDEIKVIECNLRASRSFPFVSKTLGHNFAEIATRVLVNESVDPVEVDVKSLESVAVKVPMFSFTRLKGADPTLGVEMASTGEVACYGKNKYEAYLKGLVATGFKLPYRNKNVLLSIGQYKEKLEFLASARKLSDMGFTLFGTPGTADFIHEHGIPIKALEWPSENESDEFSVTKHLSSNQIGLCILLPSNNKYRRPITFMSKGYLTRRMAVDLSIPLMTNIKTAKLLVEAMRTVPTQENDSKEILLPVSGVDRITSHNIVSLPGLVDTSLLLGSSNTTVLDENIFTSKLQSGFTNILVPIQHSDVTSLSVKEKVGKVSMSDYSFFLTAQDSSISKRSVVELRDYNGLYLNLNGVQDMQEWIDWLSAVPPSKTVFVKASGHSLAAVILIAQMTGRPVHVCNVKTPQEISIIKRAKSFGLHVTCQVDAYDLLPMSNKTDAEFLIKNLTVIDVIGGGNDLLTVLFYLLREGLITIEDIIEKTFKNPKRIFHLTNLPDTHIEVEVDQPWNEIITETEIKSTRIVHRVIIKGEIAILDGKCWATPGSGKLSLRSDDKIPEPGPTSPLSQRRQESLASSTSSIRSSRSPSFGKNKFAIQSSGSIQRSSGSSISAPDLLNIDILSVSQFDRETLHLIFQVAQEMRVLTARHGRLDILKNNVLALVFYEPSTRTAMSFSAAMERLGGSVLTTYSESSSVKKGESLQDTIRTMEQYADAIVLRHPESGSSDVAAKASRKPVINAGDGAGEHPTQALLDVFTIRSELGTVNRLHVTLVGDLKYGRTVHSLVQLLALYEVKLTYVSPKELRLPRYLYEKLENRGIDQQEVFTKEGLLEVIPHTDVLYVTRIQKERFEDLNQYDQVKGIFTITPELLTKAKVIFTIIILIIDV
eukprot:TRINITY_DN1312_c0_g1_i1.p1 TRINITY_DN1312_c0_g1~~TRINITY_DN1312_c0_g1_i1.p1  ORF type:complete len:2089 (+),score=499.75 TRINITY_DN1312_c0_g1_i1:1107-7373(+)